MKVFIIFLLGVALGFFGPLLYAKYKARKSAGGGGGGPGRNTRLK